MIRLKELEVDNENLSYGDSYDSYEFEKDNKKYILDLKYSYSEGDDEQSLKVKTIYEISENTKEKVKEKVYEYTENSSIKDYEESCYQNIFKIDKEILEDSALRLPSEKEILAKHINESYYNEKFIANQKEHYFNQFKDVFSDLVEEKNLQDKLPPFQIITENGIGLDEDKNISDELKNLILDVKGEEYWNNLNLRDVRNFEELADLGVISIGVNPMLILYHNFTCFSIFRFNFYEVL